MKLHKLRFLLLSVVGCTSVMANPRRAMLYVPHRRRDHGDPFQPVQGPKPTTSTTPPATSDTPTAVVIAITSATPAPTTSSTLSTSTTSSTLSTSTTSTQPTMTSTSTTNPTDSPIATSVPTTISSSPTLNPSTTPPPTPFTAPAAPFTTFTQQSSSPDRTWVLLGIFGLAFGLLALVIYILTSTRQHARKKRERGVKREIELLDVGGVGRSKDEEVGRAEDVNGGVGRGGGCVEVKGNRKEDEDLGKWEEMGEAKMGGEGEDEWEQGLPAYCR